MKSQGSGEEGGTISENSLNGILHSILGGSSNRSDIGSSEGEGSLGSYGDDFAFESTDSEQDGEKKPPVGEVEEADLTNHGTGKEHSVASDPRMMKTSDHPTNKGQALAACMPDAPHGGSRKENQRRSAGSIHRGEDGGFVGAGNNKDSSSNNSEQANNNNNNFVSGNSHYKNKNNGDRDNDDGRDHDDINNNANNNANNNDGDNGGGTEGENDQPIDKIHQFHKRNEAKSARWPTRESVESSSGYIFYARKAGDYPDGTVIGSGSPGRHQRRRRRRRELRRETDREEIQQKCCSQSPHNRQFKNGLHDEVGTEEADDKLSCNIDGGQSSSHDCRSPGRHAPTTAENSGAGTIRGDGGAGCSNGLSILERDVRGAMVAVWLAWGVRIDAAREEQRSEERWLEAVHRTEMAKVADGVCGKAVTANLVLCRAHKHPP